MYWDVVEVKPEPDYGLFVRFADGTCGQVQLAPAELTGVLAPLRDRSFFERVYIDQGAVAWPGEIDLAPDAMYQQSQNKGSRRRRGSGGSDNVRPYICVHWRLSFLVSRLGFFAEGL